MTQQLFNLEGRVALITGGNGGIGQSERKNNFGMIEQERQYMLCKHRPTVYPSCSEENAANCEFGSLAEERLGLVTKLPNPADAGSDVQGGQ